MTILYGYGLGQSRWSRDILISVYQVSFPQILM